MASPGRGKAGEAGPLRRAATVSLGLLFGLATWTAATPLPSSPYQPVVKVDHERERAIFRQIKAQNRRNIGDLSRFCNAELAEKGRSQRGSSFTTGCYHWQLPPGFPEPPVPRSNPMSTAKVELGRHLFYDPRLSRNRTLSCASCHQQRLAFTDGRARSLGATGDELPRSTMSLANVAYSSSLGWDDPGLRSLEAQARIPLLNEHPVEMGFRGFEAEILDRFRKDARYRSLVPAAFPEDPGPLTLDRITKALASFQRTLVSGGAPFDRWLFRGETEALSPTARRGFAAFTIRGCAGCHRPPFFSGTSTSRARPDREPELHNTGLYDVDGEGAYPPENPGAFRFTRRPEDMGRFRAPTLRNLAWTAPYMHDGSVPDLSTVLDLYAAGGRTRSPLKSSRVRPFELSPEEKADLLAFLASLDDPDFVRDPRFSDPWSEPRLSRSRARLRAQARDGDPEKTFRFCALSLCRGSL